MKNNLLETELRELQRKYKYILLEARDRLYVTDTTAIVDEINVLWQQHRKLVKCAIKHYVPPYSTYIFTAATILDIEDYEHYPFVSLGKYHIWDDPICRYIYVARETCNVEYNQKLKEQVLATIADNIKILSEAEGIIDILPVGYLSSDISQLAYRAGMRAFMSLFVKDYTYDEYKATIKTIEEVRNSLRPGMEKSIVFVEDEDTSIDFYVRFAAYRESTTLPVSKNANDAQILWFAVMGYLIQTFEILLMCTEYQAIPYIRFDVAVKYLMMILPNYQENGVVTEIVYRGIVAHILHRIIDKEIIRQHNFREYYHQIQRTEFEKRLYTELEKQGVTMNTISIKKIVEAIQTVFYPLISNQ